MTLNPIYYYNKNVRIEECMKYEEIYDILNGMYPGEVTNSE